MFRDFVVSLHLITHCQVMERRNLKQSCVAILLTMLLGMVGDKAVAHDIAVANQDGVTIYYSWINNNSELAVSCQGDSHDAYADEYSGNIVIPELVLYGGQTYKVTSIGSCAFYDCTGVTSVTIPNSVTSIGGSAFSWCSGMTSVNIPDNVVLIDGGAFYMCNSLTSLTIPKSVTTIGEEAFSYCGKLTSIKVESGNPKYDSRDNCNAIIEKGTNQLIVGCENTIIPNSVTSISHHVFLWCYGLKSLTIPNSVTAIGDWTFGGCTQLASVTIPNGMKSIGMGLFSDCRSLTTVTIPGSVTSIGDWAFYNCSALATVYVKAQNPIEIDGSNAFDKVDKTNCVIYVPKGSGNAYAAADYWKEFKNIKEMDFPNTEDGDGKVTVPDVDVLKIWMADGEVVSLALDEEPKTSYADGKLVVKTTAKTFTYPLENVRKFTYYMAKNFLLGDADGNGVVNNDDVIAVSNKILGKHSGRFVVENADMNGDNKVNAVDIVMIISMLKSQ